MTRAPRRTRQLAPGRNQVGPGRPDRPPGSSAAEHRQQEKPTDTNRHKTATGSIRKADDPGSQDTARHDTGATAPPDADNPSAEPVDKAGEIWKPVKGYEGLYSVSNLGSVKAHARMVATGNGKTRTEAAHLLKITHLDQRKAPDVFCGAART